MTIEKLQGTVTKMSVTYHRRQSHGGDAGWDTKEFGITVEVSMDADADFTENARVTYADLKKKVDAVFPEPAPQQTFTPETQEKVDLLYGTEPTYNAVQPPQEQVPPGVTETIPVTHLRVEFDQKGQKRLKVLGGRWEKYGVMVWPEVYHPLGINITPLDAADYPPPHFGLAATLKAVVEMDGEKPRKVVGWVR